MKNVLAGKPSNEWRDPDPKFQVETGSTIDEAGNSYPLPKVTLPGQFRDYPQVQGTPRLHQAVRALLNAVPDLQGRTNKISNTPTKGIMELALESNYPIQRLANSNYGGLTDRRTGEVWITPNESHPTGATESILAHEMGHVSGLTHGHPAMEELELIGQERLNRHSPNFVPVGTPYKAKVR